MPVVPTVSEAAGVGHVMAADAVVVDSMKSGTPNFRVLYRQPGPMPTGPQAKDAITPRGVSHRKMMTMRLLYLRRNRAWLRHGGIDCRCCACWGWLVLGCGGGWSVHSCG